MTTQETLGKVQNELSEAQLEEATGGSTESQITSTVQNMVSQTVKAIGEGLSSVAKSG